MIPSCGPSEFDMFWPSSDTSFMGHEIEYSVDGNVGTLLINRPEARNALNWEAQQQFAQLVEQISKDPQLRILIIIGEGDRAFASGGDLKELVRFPDRSDGERLTQIMGTALNQLTHLSIPVVGAVNGDAIGGGCEILTACDLRIASPHAQFRFAQIHQALTTGWGGSARLVRLIDQSRAADLLMTGRSFSATEALSIGFIHRIAKTEFPLLQAALEWAHELQSLPKDTMSAIKKLIWASSQLTLPDAYSLENQQFVDLWTHPDHREAVEAFIRKRKARH